MEIHLVATLDSNGCLQSMQSNCIQQRFDGNSNSRNDWIPPREIKPPEKDLVYKLDAKIDEMSLLMIQLAELNKRTKLQEKLINEYEEKDRQKTLEISRLREENDRLRLPSANMVRIRPSSWESSMSCTTPKSVRSSVTNIKMVCSLQTDVQRSPEYSTTSNFTGKTEINAKTTLGLDELDCAQRDEHGSVNNVFLDESPAGETLRNSSDTCNTKQSDLSQVSTKSLTLLRDFGTDNARVDTAISSVDGGADDCVTHRPVSSRRCRSDPEPNLEHCINCFGYAIHGKHETYEETESLADSFNNKLLQDQHGYVILTGNSTATDTIPDSDVTVSNEAEKHELQSVKRKTNENIENPEQTTDCVHTAWSDVNVSMKIPECNTREDDQWVYKPDVKCHFFINQPGYVEIPPEEVRDKPPLPLPSQQRSNNFGGDLNGINKYKNRPLIPTPSERSTKYSSSKSVESNESPTAPCYGTRNRLSENENSTCACEVNKNRELVYRHSSPDLRNEDKSNSLIRTMRTTMEWNQTKKALMGRSHTCTNEQAEEVLRGVVQITHRACEQFQLKYQQRKKSTACSTTKVIQFIRKSVKNSCDEDILTDEFLKKCLEVWNNVKYCKTP